MAKLFSTFGDDARLDAGEGHLDDDNLPPPPPPPGPPPPKFIPATPKAAPVTSQAADSLPMTSVVRPVEQPFDPTPSHMTGKGQVSAPQPAAAAVSGPPRSPEV